MTLTKIIKDYKFFKRRIEIEHRVLFKEGKSLDRFAKDWIEEAWAADPIAKPKRDAEKSGYIGPFVAIARRPLMTAASLIYISARNNYYNTDELNP